MASIPFWAGKDLTVIFFQDNDRVEIDVISMDVERVGTAAEDHVCSEDRGRQQFITDHFSISLEVMQKELEALDAMFDDQDNLDARAVPLERSVGMAIHPRNGTRALCNASEVTVDNWRVSVGGRTERNKMTLPMRARYFKQL